MRNIIIGARQQQNKMVNHKQYVYNIDSNSIFHGHWTKYITWCSREFNQNINYYIDNINYYIDTKNGSTLNISFDTEEDLSWFLLNRTNIQ